MFTSEELEALSYREVQGIAKIQGLPANKKKEQLITSIVASQIHEINGENSNELNSTGIEEEFKDGCEIKSLSLEPSLEFFADNAGLGTLDAATENQDADKEKIDDMKMCSLDYPPIEEDGVIAATLAAADNNNICDDVILKPKDKVVVHAEDENDECNEEFNDCDDEIGVADYDSHEGLAGERFDKDQVQGEEGDLYDGNNDDIDESSGMDKFRRIPTPKGKHLYLMSPEGREHEKYNVHWSIEEYENDTTTIKESRPCAARTPLTKLDNVLSCVDSTGKYEICCDELCCDELIVSTNSSPIKDGPLKLKGMASPQGKHTVFASPLSDPSGSENIAPFAIHWSQSVNSPMGSL